MVIVLLFTISRKEITMQLQQVPGYQVRREAYGNGGQKGAAA